LALSLKELNGAPILNSDGKLVGMLNARVVEIKDEEILFGTNLSDIENFLVKNGYKSLMSNHTTGKITLEQSINNIENNIVIIEVVAEEPEIIEKPITGNRQSHRR
jgi:sporulation protein YlmC with PRC-barrel domain